MELSRISQPTGILQPNWEPAMLLLKITIDASNTIAHVAGTLQDEVIHLDGLRIPRTTEGLSIRVEILVWEYTSRP